MIAVTTFSGRTVAVFGLARSGLAAARALLAGGAKVACWDDGARGRDAAAAEGLPLVDLREADWRGFAALVLTPGVPLTHPEPHWTVKRAGAARVEVIGDTELFFRELAKQASPPKVIAITGTNGKSTTTALSAHLHRSLTTRVAMGGNIGEAVLGLTPFDETDVYVLEFSSYQIDLTPTLRPDVGILLNISPDHLDRHGTMQHYADVKERLVAGAKFAVVGIDDKWCRNVALRRLSKGQTTIGVHVRSDPTRSAEAVTVQDLQLFAQAGGALIGADAGGDIFQISPALQVEGRLVSLAGLATLRGTHNAQNAAAAVCAAGALGLCAVRLDSKINSFPGLAHRMEMLGHVGESRFVNDSKATNADSTAKALNSFGKNILWIAGGKAKDGGIESLAPFFGNVRHVYLIGEASEAFAATLGQHGVAFSRCGTMANAVAEIAKGPASPPMGGWAATVLLSPACASFDQFKDFEDRGDQFRALVAAIPGFVPFGGKGGA